MPETTLPARSEIPAEDTWDLASLYADDAAWEADFTRWEKLVEGYSAFRGRMKEGAKAIVECLEFDLDCDRLGERLGTYAFLKETEDTANGVYQGLRARCQGVAARAAELGSFLRPELLALPDSDWEALLAHPLLQPHLRALTRLRRHKPHTLTPAEERLLAMQSESAQTARTAFGVLTNADMKFGTIEVGGKRIPLSHGSFSRCLHDADRTVRETAFRQYYVEFADHAQTLAATLCGSVRQDVFAARARNYPSCLEAALFDDHLPVAVYDQLIAAVRGGLPALHRYYDVRQRAMGLAELHHFDTYVPILADLQTRIEWDEAVSLTLAALAPLGPEYRAALAAGFDGRWCDKYENRGKRSGAFSAGSFDGAPYILMNYQPDVLDHVFTLAHEAGHSMHSWHSAKEQPYQTYNYTIFVAEVASTFNEQLLSRKLLAEAKSDRDRAYHLNRELDAMRGTIYRQTMFAEFEKRIHELAEANQPLTLDVFKAEYRQLLAAYFGPRFALDAELDLECLRIPHFYNAFYVFKYATGLSAAIALAERVATGGAAELADYLGFLKGGCSQDPLDLLRGAGVDMATPGPVAAALARFAELVDELDRLV